MVGELVTEIGDGGILFGNEIMTAFAVYAPNDGYTTLEPFVFAEKGLYFLSAEGMGVSSLTINGYNGFETTETVPLPNKYLDIIETVGGDTLTWDGNIEGLESADVVGDGSLYYRVTDVYPTIQEAQNGGIVHTNDVELGDLWVNAIDMTEQFGVECYLLAAANGVPVAVCVSQNVTIEGNGDLHKGIYLEPTVRSLTINGYTGFTKEQVKEEYLPSGAVKYYSDTTYLYKDKALTTKVTANELAKVKDTKTIVVGVIDGGEEFATATVILSTIFDGVGQVIVPFGIDAETSELQTMTVYTSEYTPTE